MDKTNAEMSLGEFYGYPPCCIEFFEKNSSEPNWFNKYLKEYPKAAEKFKHGFIPCEKHMKELEESDIQPSDLIKNRKCPTPFPVDFDILGYNFLFRVTKMYGVVKGMDLLIALHKELDAKQA